MNGNFSEAIKIFLVGFGLVLVIMAALSFIMESVGKIVGKYEKKKEGSKKW